MADIARIADVSISTVSRALRDPQSVSEILRDRIHVAADRLGYAPSPIAGSLSGRRSPLVGVVVPSMSNAFFSRSLESIMLGLASENLQVMAGFHEYDAQREEDLIATLMAWKPAALVVTGITPSRRVLAQLSRVECPLIQMWDIDGTPIDSAIGFSNSAAGRMAAQHLVERGHRDIAIVSATNLGDPRARARATAFFETARKLGVEVRQIEAPDRSMTAGALFMREAVARKELPAALAFSGDSLAMGALLEAQRLGISVPDDIAVIGYGDLEFASLANPGLTTIRPPHEEMGAAVAEHIRKRLKDISSANETIDLGVKLIVREST